MKGALSQLQEALSQQIRGRLAYPGLDEPRVALYRSLTLSNLHAVISPCFPILLSILPGSIWQDILENFLASHSVKNPLFHQLASEMVSFLQQNPVVDYPFAAELAHYEWMELAVEISDSHMPALQEKPHDVLQTCWGISSSARMLHYRFPVQTINLHAIPTDETPTFLIVYRIAESVHFMKITEFGFQLLNLMAQEHRSPAVIISELAEVYPTLDVEPLYAGVRQLLSMLFVEQIVYVIDDSEMEGYISQYRNPACCD